MKFNLKNYQISKTKQYIKKKPLFFLFNGIKCNSNDWILIEQGLKLLTFNYYKIFNKAANKTFTNSIYIRIKQIIDGITFFVKPINVLKQLSKDKLLHNFEPLFFVIITIKLNNKIYTKNQLKNIFLFNYDENKLLLFQYRVVNLKFHFNKKSK